jgi:hypothetical protein
VCRAWNAALAERSLWARLDLSPASGVAVTVTGAVLEAAAARAGGQLEKLDLTDCHVVGTDAVLAVVLASGASLRELRVCSSPNTNAAGCAEVDSVRVEALLRAAPQLRMFDVDVGCNSTADASRLLRNEPPFAPLHVLALTVKDEAPDEAAVLALAAAVAGHAWLTELALQNMPLTAAAASLDALVDAALARRLRAVRVYGCQLSRAFAPACVRLLSGGLVELSLGDMEQLDVPAALLLSNALRASTTLTSFQLSAADLWCDPVAAALLLGALVSHRSLRELDVSYNDVTMPALQPVAVLAALVVANVPALHTLDISYCRLGDAAMGMLVDALPQNNHLRTLKCAGNDMTEGFIRNRLLPAVQANASLRKLILMDDYDDDKDDDDDDPAQPATLLELQDLVAARGAAGVPQ